MRYELLTVLVSICHVLPIKAWKFVPKHESCHGQDELIPAGTFFEHLRGDLLEPTAFVTLRLSVPVACSL